MSAAVETGLMLRAASPTDLQAIERFIDGLSPRSRADRFFVPLREMPGVMREAIRSGEATQQFVIATQGSEVVALGQYAIDREHSRCEVALVVADEWQRRGLGRQVLDWLLADAQHAGLREAVLETLPGNRAMQILACRAGFDLSRHPEDSKLLFGQRTLARLPGTASTDAVWTPSSSDPMFAVG